MARPVSLTAHLSPALPRLRALEPGPRPPALPRGGPLGRAGSDRRVWLSVRWRAGWWGRRGGGGRRTPALPPRAADGQEGQGEVTAPVRPAGRPAAFVQRSPAGCTPARATGLPGTPTAGLRLAPLAGEPRGP